MQIVDHQDDWFVREVLGMLRSTLARLDGSSLSLFEFVTLWSETAGKTTGLASAIALANPG